MLTVWFLSELLVISSVEYQPWYVHWVNTFTSVVPWYHLFCPMDKQSLMNVSIYVIFESRKSGKFYSSAWSTYYYICWCVQVLATCEANELAEVAGPAVAGVLSLWDLLLLRVEAVRAEESYVVTLCDELQSLLEKVQTVASEILKPLDVKSESKEHQLEVNLLYCPEYYMFCEQRQNIDFGTHTHTHTSD